MKRKHHSLIGILFLISGLITSIGVMAQESYYDVLSATPDMALQGTINLDVEISGNYFDNSIDSVNFQARCEDPLDPCVDAGLVKVNHFVVRGSKKIIANIDVPDNAILPAGYKGHDVEIRSLARGRGGKGTTLFKVQSKDTNPSECNFDFEATFDDFQEDGVTSDGQGFYDAFGGRGFRLDTNGSMKNEQRGDTRFVRIDFTDAMPDDVRCDLNDPHNAGGASGFCDELQGIDLRLEHQIQDLEANGLCTMQPGDRQQLAVRLGFTAEDGAMLENEFKNGKVNGGGSPPNLSLSYGCLAPSLDQDDLDLANRPWVTRVNSTVWRIEGTRACLHTNLGHMLEDSGKNTIYLNVPFGLTIVIVGL